MKPYASDYPIAANLAAPSWLAQGTRYSSVFVSGCPISGQDGELGRGGNRICRTSAGRVELQAIQRFLRSFECVFAPEDMAYLTTEREFIGAQWFGLLMAEPVTRFCIRESELLRDGQKSLKAAVVFQDLQPHHPAVLSGKRRLWGHWLYLVG